MGAERAADVAPADIRPESGACWQIRDLPFPPGDDLWRPKHSRLILLEDGHPLGQGHAFHDHIRQWGGGRYSHWLRGLYFSTGDGSDPRTNGKRYHLEWRDEPETLVPQPWRRDGIARLVDAVHRRDEIDRSELIAALSTGSTAERAWGFHALGDAFLDAGMGPRGAMQLWRAWQLGRRRPAMWHPIQRWLSETGQTESLRSLYRNGAIAADRADDPDWMCDVLAGYETFVFSNYEQTRSLPFQDDIIIDAAARLLARHALTPTRMRPDHGPIRIGYLLTGEAETRYCSLAEIALELVLAHAPHMVDACAISLYPREQILTNNPPFAEWLGHLDAAGRAIHHFDASRASANFADTKALALDIAGLDLDVLVFAGQTGLRLLLTGLRPAPMMLGLGLGEIQLYTSKLLDLTAHINIKPAMDGLSPSVVLPSFMPRGRFHHPEQPVDSQTLGIPAEAVLLMSSARAVKFREAEYWQVMDRVLQARPNTWLALVGLDAAEFDGIAQAYHVSAAACGRIRCLGWRSDHQAVLGAADIFVDTFPNGGGYSVFEALNLGIATLALEDDYLLPFEERSWAVAAEIVGGDIAVPFHMEAVTARLLALIDDPALRGKLATDGPRLADAVRSAVPCARALERCLLQDWVPP